ANESLVLLKPRAVANWNGRHGSESNHPAHPKYIDAVLVRPDTAHRTEFYGADYFDIHRQRHLPRPHLRRNTSWTGMQNDLAPVYQNGSVMDGAIDAVLH